MALCLKRFIDVVEVRQMCVDHRFYTLGSNEEYSHMFELCLGHFGGYLVTARDLEAIADDIVSHSTIENLQKCYGYSHNYTIEVMQELVNKCCCQIVTDSLVKG